jgi:hypothetical protein
MDAGRRLSRSATTAGIAAIAANPKNTQPLTVRNESNICDHFIQRAREQSCVIANFIADHRPNGWLGKISTVVGAESQKTSDF